MEPTIDQLCCTCKYWLFVTGGKEGFCLNAENMKIFIDEDGVSETGSSHAEISTLQTGERFGCIHWREYKHGSEEI